jgi:hypothetical protein
MNGGSNFNRLVDAGVVWSEITAEQQKALEKLSDAQVDAIVDAYNRLRDAEVPLGHLTLPDDIVLCIVL